MGNERSPRSAVYLIVVALFLAVLPVAYLTGYLTLGEYIDWRANPGKGPTGIERNYHQQWHGHFFRPAASIESLILGCDVVISYSPQSQLDSTP
jgi:hypothetical protein